MKEKFLQFFTGKMGKSVYIAAVSVIVCLATVIGSAAISHSHNKKIDTVLESLAQAESTAETVTESASESVSVLDKETNESNGDKALQYLAEYNKLTAEYEKKKAELEKKAVIPEEPDYILIKSKPVDKSSLVDSAYPELYMRDRAEYERLVAQYKAEYEQDLKKWEEQSRTDEQINEQYKKEYEQKISTAEAAKKEIENLDAQYKKDIATLKSKYGIA